MSYKVTPSVDSLGLSQYQLQFIQYLTYSSQPLPSSPSQVKSPSTTPYQHIPKRAHSSSARSSSRGFPRSPLEWLAFPFQFIFCAHFETVQSTTQVFDKLLKLSFISSIPKDLSSLILFFKSVTLIAIIVFACLELIFSLESKCFNVTFQIGLYCLQST